MKELSINEKAKAYDEAIERAKKLYGNEIAEEIFHELKECDDERIKKNCIHFLELQKQHHAATFEIEECIAWLEKKCETYPILSNSSNTGKNEQKSADKIEPRFDPKTLKAFDKVLVRLTKDCIWNATFFSHYDKEVNWGCYPCVTTSCKSYDKCIPYNEDTKHLLGTSDEAPEYYRYWEE